jgi:hypothetical protein
VDSVSSRTGEKLTGRYLNLKDSIRHFLKLEQKKSYYLVHFRKWLILLQSSKVLEYVYR